MDEAGDPLSLLKRIHLSGLCGYRIKSFNVRGSKS